MGAFQGAAVGAITGGITGAITGDLSTAYCFTAGTGVLTAEGLTAIEEIKEGDKVWSWDERSGKKELKEVIKTYINETSELIYNSQF